MRAELPIGLLLSGPAGGVIGGRCDGDDCGRDNIITIDIGGTSADISIIPTRRSQDHEPARHRGRRPAGAGADDRLDAIGAGGGSIAYIDPRRRAFSVGPRSAGAEPGPACYGKGGEEPTVTDAQVVLGRLDPEHFLGGDLRSMPDSRAQGDRAKHIAKPLGLSVEEAALGIFKIVNNNMALAINCQLGRQGHRSAQLLADGFRRRRAAAFGVAWPRRSAAKDVIVPVQPGITAAIGLLQTDLQYEYTHSTLAHRSSKAGEAELRRANAVARRAD